MKTLILVLLFSSGCAAQNYPTPVPGDFLMRDFKFQSGESLPELKMHYVALGTAVKDKNGQTTNAVLVLHGTGGSHANLLRPSFAGALFGKGQLLDAEKYFIVIPDNIGHGASSKPSDGLHMKFPRYNYHDLITVQYRLVTEKLGVNHLRLVMGTSMGGMHSWIWTEEYPDFMDAAMPLASLPVEISGRNRVWRRMIIDSIKNDPDWQNGEYKTQPVRGLTSAVYMLTIMGSAPLEMQKQAPTKAAADKLFDETIKARLPAYDANDVIYHFDSSRDYNPAPKLEMIKAHLVAVNSADDEINPPELGIAEREIKRVKKGKFVLLPISDETRGHGQPYDRRALAEISRGAADGVGEEVGEVVILSARSDKYISYPLGSRLIRQIRVQKEPAYTDSRRSIRTFCGDNLRLVVSIGSPYSTTKGDRCPKKENAPPDLRC